jgi:hypothetical protein
MDRSDPESGPELGDRADLEAHGRDGLAAGEGGADGSGGGGVEHAGERHPLVHAQRVPHEHHRLPAPPPQEIGAVKPTHTHI